MKGDFSETTTRILSSVHFMFPEMMRWRTNLARMYKAPPKRQLSEEERITVNMGGTLAPTAAPAGIAGTGITALSQVAPPPPPETAGAYAKKGEASNGVIAMMDMMIADLDKEITETEVNEKEGQQEYEQFMSDAAEKRALDSKVNRKGVALPSGVLALSLLYICT